MDTNIATPFKLKSIIDTSSFVIVNNEPMPNTAAIVIGCPNCGINFNSCKTNEYRPLSPLKLNIWFKQNREYLSNILPHYCPECGQKLSLETNPVLTVDAKGNIIQVDDELIMTPETKKEEQHE